MSETILNMLPLTEEEKAVFEAAAPDAVHLYAGRRTATPEQFAQATVILGWPRPNMVAQAAHLKWFHCMWAGTEEYVDVMPAGAAPVSYTHLDVYKRQGLWRGQGERPEGHGL